MCMFKILGKPTCGLEIKLVFWEEIVSTTMLAIARVGWMTAKR